MPTPKWIDTPQIVPNSHWDGTCNLPTGLWPVSLPVSVAGWLILLPVTLLLSLSSLYPWAVQLPPTPWHQPLLTPQSQELSHVFSEPCTDIITDYLTISCVAFIEEKFFCSHNWPFKISQWNTIPVPLRISYLELSYTNLYDLTILHGFAFLISLWLHSPQENPSSALPPPWNQPRILWSHERQSLYCSEKSIHLWCHVLLSEDSK